MLKRRWLLLDVSRAYFYARATDKVFVRIPEEDFEPGDEGKVGLLNYSLYGTRAAAGNCEREYSEKLAMILTATEMSLTSTSIFACFANPQR